MNRNHECDSTGLVTRRPEERSFGAGFGVSRPLGIAWQPDTPEFLARTDLFDLRTNEVARYLRTRDLLGLLGISRVTLWTWRRRGLFPPPRRLGPNTIAWTVEDVQAWQSSRPPA